MSTTTTRGTTPRDRDSVEHRLARLLDSPLLARVVPHLAPETLHRLIQHRGLDACGELVTSTTPAQLTSLLDLDLWRGTMPGRDARFDVDRFGEWLEVLVDTGELVAARTIAALDTHLVVLGLSRYLRVFDPGTFEPTESTDDEPADRHEMMSSQTSADVLECEVGGYLVRARRRDAWDAIVALLVTLEGEHDRCFHAVMQGCRRLSNSRPEVDGLDDLLMAPEQRARDVADDRERRQSRHGYATAGDARAFLQMARHPHRTPQTRTSSESVEAEGKAPRAGISAVVAAYFREDAPDDSDRDTAAGAEDRAPHDEASAPVPRDHDDIRPTLEAVIELLTEAGLMSERPRALLEPAADDLRAPGVPLLRRLMASVRHHDETAYLARGRELAFLANSLLAGCSVQSRPFTPQEASDAARCICNLGLECWPARWPGARSPEAASSLERDTAVAPVTFLVDHDLVRAFEVGWSVLYEDVSLFVADRLVATLTDLQCGDADTRRGLRALRHMLVKQRAAGTPWLARDAADVLATLDTTAWVSVLGLLDECPILPAALRATLERRTTPVSATAFEFISTASQIRDIRLFMRTLPTLLSA